MTDNVLSMSKATGDASLRSPEQALQDALDTIGKEGAFKDGKKLLVLALDEQNDQYKISWMQAGMKMSECVTLCEMAKGLFKEEMNY